MSKYLLSFFLLLGVNSLVAQDCFNFYKTNCCPEKSVFPYVEHEKSVSFAFSPGDSKCVSVNLIQGKDYRITLCSDSLYTGVVSLLIRTEMGDVIYDNSSDNFSQSIEFSCRKSNYTEFILTAPNRTDVPEGLKGCIGMLVEEIISPKIGF